MSDIFRRTSLSPSQARTVARRRLRDAECLEESGENARANGVFYLGGLVIECLLKAELLEKFPEVVSPVHSKHLSEVGKGLNALIFRSHALEEMLAELTDLARDLQQADDREGRRRLKNLRAICSTWTIFARYSPFSETMANAAEFLDRVREIERWLNNR